MQQENNIKLVEPSQVDCRKRGDASVGHRKKRKRSIENTTPKLKSERVEIKPADVDFDTEANQKFNELIDFIINDTNNNGPEIGENEQDKNVLDRKIMQEFVTVMVKLKVSHKANLISVDKLLSVLNFMDSIIRKANETFSSVVTGSIKEVEGLKNATDACLVCLYIMTTRDMPKRIYLEDIIDRVICFVKDQLCHTIFPAFDCTYEIDIKKKEKSKKIVIIDDCLKLLYDRITEVMILLTELVQIQIFDDASVFCVSSLAISSFFVENIDKLQQSCLELLTTMFLRYEKYRIAMLDNILLTAARLPLKCSMITYKLDNDERIQVFTALTLQLIQSITSCENSEHLKTKKVDSDDLFSSNYKKATGIAGMFLTRFLDKLDKVFNYEFKPLFEAFIRDILLTVHKPEFPISELLFRQVGKMLVSTFSNKDADLSLRTASVDYLVLMMVRLRKDSILVQSKTNLLDKVIVDIKSQMSDAEENEEIGIDLEQQKVQLLQDALLDFLTINMKGRQTVRSARNFYIALWYNDAVTEAAPLVGDKKSKVETTQTHRRNSRKRKSTDDEAEVNAARASVMSHKTAIKFNKIEARKQLLMNKSRQQQNRIETFVHCNDAQLIVQYLVSKKGFFENFDQYFTAVLSILKDALPVIRTKALKCLATIFEVDLSLLTRNDIQSCIVGLFCDPAASAREAAVDLIGKFMLKQRDLIDKHYEALSARLLDISGSVCKRTVRILRDFCIKYPDFAKIPDICMRMMRRISDEEGIGKFIVGVFEGLWFTPSDHAAVKHKLVTIIKVVEALKDVGYEWFEQLLVNLFKSKEDKNESTEVQMGPPQSIISACMGIINCLMQDMSSLHEKLNVDSNLSQLVLYLTTLCLFAKIHPQLLVKHVHNFQCYLNIRCESSEAVQVIANAVRILSLVVPLIHCPSFVFLAQLEQDCMKLVHQHNSSIVASCLSCLGSIINNLTHNFKLIRDCFEKYYGYIAQVKSGTDLDDGKNVLDDVKCRQYFKRALCVIGLLFRYFNFDDPEVLGELSEDIKDRVFKTLLVFLQGDEDVKVNVVKAIGSMCTRHSEFLLDDKLKSFYHRTLIAGHASVAVKSEIIITIEMYLLEEDRRMMQRDLEYKKNPNQQSFKEMTDDSAGKSSTIIQYYLKPILESYVDLNVQVRQPALRVIHLILQQGFVHPVQIVPYLICMSTDCDRMVSHNADRQLMELERKYPGFIYTKSSLGLSLSYKLQKILQKGAIVRGFHRKEQDEHYTALNGYFYSILQNFRQQRRALVLNILKQFEEQQTDLSYLLYLADNVAYFPYLVQDELLFIIHRIDVMISYTGMNLLQSFREGLVKTKEHTQDQQVEPLESNQNAISALDEDEDSAALIARLPQDVSHLQACLNAAQGCLLLLVLKQHLKTAYGLSENKIRQYSPLESAKPHEKQITRNNVHFNPTVTIVQLQGNSLLQHLDENGRNELVNQYLDFKHLMLKLDRDDDNDNLVGVKRESNAGIVTIPGLHSVSFFSSQADEIDQIVQAGSSKKRTPRKTPVMNRISNLPQKKRRKRIALLDEEARSDDSDSDFVP